jgi:hypothetical protein
MMKLILLSKFSDYLWILLQQLFHWAAVLKRIKIIFHELITESEGKELRQLLMSFSRPDICMDISMFVP